MESQTKVREDKVTLVRGNEPIIKYLQKVSELKEQPNIYETPTVTRKRFSPPDSHKVRAFSTRFCLCNNLLEKLHSFENRN